MKPEPETTKNGMFSMQACVPDEYNDAAVLDFANTDNPCGTEHGWHIRRDGDKSLSGDPERNPCLKRKGCVHIMLDA